MSMLMLLFIAFTSTTCTKSPATPSTEEAKSVVMEKIQAANKAWASGNPMVFHENAANDIVWIDDVGPSKRLLGRDELKSYLESLKGVVPPHKHELYDFNFQFYDDIVIASYFYGGTVEGQKGTPWKAVSIFKYMNGDWLAVMEHWTQVVCAENEAASEDI